MTRLVSRRMQFVEIDPEGRIRHGGSAPYLSYETPGPEHRGVRTYAATPEKPDAGAPWLPLPGPSPARRGQEGRPAAGAGWRAEFPEWGWASPEPE